MSRRLGALLAVLLVLLGAGAPARAQTPADSDLKRAKDRYEYGDYADAAKLLRHLVDDGRLTSDGQLVEAYRLLGLSYFYESKHEEARSAFVRLLSIEPDYHLDPFFNPPKVVEFFDQVKADNEALLAPIRAQKAKVEKERRRQEQAQQHLLEEEARRRESLARQQQTATPPKIMEKVVADHPYLLNWLPFGVGQFQNGQPYKGGLLAGAETLTGLASIIGFVVVSGLRTCTTLPVPKGDLGDPTQTETQCGIPADSVSLARTMDRVKWIAGGAFWGLVVYGIVDAHLHYQHTVVLSQQPIDAPAPPAGTGEEKKAGAQAPPTSALAPSLDLLPFFGPTGGGAVLTLRF